MKHTNKRHPLDVRKKLDLTSKQKKKQTHFRYVSKKTQRIIYNRIIAKKTAPLNS